MSSAFKQMNDEELLEILTTSRKNNEAVDITGMLLYGEGAFVQVLEGGGEAVDAMFATIKKDPRHKNVIQIISGDLEKRNFPDWTMGFKTADAEVMKEFEGFINVRTDGHLIQDETHPAITVLKTFAGVNNMH
jgi:hypothetical protein